MSTKEGKEVVLAGLKFECEDRFGEVGWEKMEKNLEVTAVSCEICQYLAPSCSRSRPRSVN